MRSQRKFIVTGANSGIGFNAAEGRRTGGQVVLVCRSPDKGRAHRPESSHRRTRPCSPGIADFSSMQSVSALADRLQSSTQIHVLCITLVALTPVVNLRLRGLS